MSNRSFRSRPLSLISPIAFAAGLVLGGCSSKIQMGTVGDTGGSTGIGGITGGASGVDPATGGADTTAPETGGAMPTGIGGSATAGATTVSNVTKVTNNHLDAIDLLLMIDNSASMADKQATLAAAVPQLLGQLAQPRCVDSTGNYVGTYTLGSAVPCAVGVPEFAPINNIHIGVVTSSLGDHGANTICTPGAATNYVDDNGTVITQPPDVNDMGHLVGTLDRATVARSDPQMENATVNSLGFLEWGNAALPTPSAVDLAAGTKILADLVTAAKERGCGYESQLESWFRFLIDPVPPILPLAQPNISTHMTARQGSDDTLLNERAAFLRPDSLVAIVMLTDENDCSIRDTDVGWVSATTQSSILTGSAQCADNPNDKCCYSCTSTTPAGCADGCGSVPAQAANDGVYQANLRCWNQKRRFGYEFLYPTSRYVVGLTKPELCPDQSFGDMDCDCTYARSIGASCSPGNRRMPNPLYSTTVGTLNNGQTIVGYPKELPRTDNSRVLLAGIVGVPWQDIATVGSDGTLKYIPVTDPAWTQESTTTPVNPPSNGATGIWDMIYGKDAANIAPRDVHMVESVVPRLGLAGPTAAANADAINGHEYNTALMDFEYACTYQLPTSRACLCDPSMSNYAACKFQHPNDCCDTSYKVDGAGGPGGNFDKPLCDGTTQVAAKAYPGLREIEVLHDYANARGAGIVSGNSVVASICPKDLTSDPSSPGYGYNPFVSALIDRMKPALAPTDCAPTPTWITVNASGGVDCRIVEALPPSSLLGESCTELCQSRGRHAVSSTDASDAAILMRDGHVCDTGVVACSEMCLCQLDQESGSNLTTCLNDPDGPSTTALPPGFCYVDPSQGAGNAALVNRCPSTQQRRLRYVGNNPSTGIFVPLKGAYTLLVCDKNN